MTKFLSDPPLLRIPEHFHSVEDALACAGKINLTNVLILSERDNGGLCFLDSGLTIAEANWIVDRFKALMLVPSKDTERVEGPTGGDAA